MDLTLHIWRQKDGKEKGARAPTYQASNISEHMSFLEMLDVVNQQLLEKGEEPIAYDCDCLEGICGACSLVINGVPHGPNKERQPANFIYHKFQGWGSHHHRALARGPFRSD